jgi:hypothetical protein
MFTYSELQKSQHRLTAYTSQNPLNHEARSMRHDRVHIRSDLVCTLWSLHTAESRPRSSPVLINQTDPQHPHCKRSAHPAPRRTRPPHPAPVRPRLITRPVYRSGVSRPRRDTRQHVTGTSLRPALVDDDILARRHPNLSLLALVQHVAADSVLLVRRRRLLVPQLAQLPAAVAHTAPS